MARFIDMPGKEIWATVTSLSKAGFDDRLAALLRKEGNAERAVEILSREFFPETEEKLTGVASSPFIYSAAEQVASVLRWNEKFKGGFTKRQIQAMRDIAPHAARYPFETTVLVPYLGKVEKTMEFWMAVLADTHPNFTRWPELKSDPKHLRLLKECGEFPASTLRWEHIDLGAHWNGEDDDTDPKSVRGANSAHFGVYATLAHNPAYAETMNGTDRPYFWVPGLEVHVGGSGSWTGSPRCDWDSVRRRLLAVAGYSDDRYSSYSVPVLREVWS